jgi:Fic/DOC family
MKPDWDADSPELVRNIVQLLQSIQEDALRRHRPSVESARHWQIELMRDLEADKPNYIGAFRGEAGLEFLQVHVDWMFGVAAHEVAPALDGFERRLQSAVSLLDRLIASGAEPTSEQVHAILDLCGWAHAEWVRIHPFANGNGRTARLWANSLALRYGLPPFLHVRPRPGGEYEIACAKAMQGDWEPMADLFGRLLEEFVSGTFEQPD